MNKVRGNSFILLVPIFNFIANTKIIPLSWLVFIVISFASFSSCITRRMDETIDRKVSPLINSDIAITTSEIRQVKDHKLSEGFGKNALYLRGQLFTKSQSKDGIKMQPCVGCEIILRTAADTSVKVLLTTELDGYFQFNGQSLAYSFLLENQGLNTLIIEKVDFRGGGVFTMIIINAAGKESEKFSVSHKDRVYTWDKVL